MERRQGREGRTQRAVQDWAQLRSSARGRGRPGSWGLQASSSLCPEVLPYLRRHGLVFSLRRRVQEAAGIRGSPPKVGLLQ